MKRLDGVNGFPSFPGLLVVALGLMGCGPQVASVQESAEGTGSGTDVTSTGTEVGGVDSTAQSGTAGGMSAATSNDADSGAGSDAGNLPQLFELTLILDNGPWMIVQDAAGIAVDHDERVYITDEDSVYLVDGTEVTTYLTSEDGLMRPADLDVGPDGTLYVLGSVGIEDHIWRSTAAHQLEPIFQLEGLVFPSHLGVADGGAFAVISRDGLSMLSDAGQMLVYGEADQLDGTDCATEDLAVQDNGVFLYQPGCNVSPIIMGTLDGTGTRSLFGTFEVGGFQNALCATRSPLGGFYVVMIHGPTQLVHFTDEATEQAGWTPIPTTPTLDEAAVLSGQAFAFRYCSIAAAPSGTIYLQTRSELWKATPVP